MSQDLDQQVRKAVADFCRQAPRRYPVISIALAAILGIGLALFLIWQVPHWQVPKAGLTTKEWLHQINENRKSVAQMVGGVFILWGLYIAWVRSKAMRDQAEVDREQQLTDLYVKAIEQLGSEKLQIRLGGIYALERIARESAKDHWPIMEVLTAFVRENAPLREEAPEAAAAAEEASAVPELEAEADPETPIPVEKPPTDIQAVLTVLGRTAIAYAQEGEKRSLDLRATYLAGIDLEGAQLQRIFLTRANLQDANLTKANLIGGKLNEANLIRAYLDDANLQGASLTFANLYDAFLDGANLQEAGLNKANLRRAELMACNLQKATFCEANLSEADLSYTNLQKAFFLKANLQGADLEKTELKGVELSSVQGLTPEQVAKSIWDETTRWPEGFSPPPPEQKDEEKE